MTTYTLGSIKLAGGDETPRFTARIYKDGIAVGTVSNGGTGGCCDYYWPHGIEERKPFLDWIAANHPDDFEPDDGWVYKQLDAHQELKTLKRWAKKKTIFRLDGDKPEEGYRQLKVPFGEPGVIEYLKKHHDGKGEVFDPARAVWVRI